MPPLYSIGYATKPLALFLEQLRQQQVKAIADVRSVPYSKRFHDYHQQALATTLRAEGIHYVYLGEELGPRSTDPSHYDDRGQVQFDRLQRSALFGKGITRLQAGREKGLAIAMLCAEKDPAHCHRSLLIGQYLLARHNLDCRHITHGGGIETQSALEQRLIAEHHIQADMLSPQCECLERARQAQTQQYAYRKPEH